MMHMTYRRRQELSIVLMITMVGSFLAVSPAPAEAGFLSGLKTLFTVGTSLMAGLVGGGIGLAVGGLPGMLIGGIGASLLTYGALNWAGNHLPELAGASAGAVIGSRFGVFGTLIGMITGAFLGDKISDAVKDRQTTTKTPTKVDSPPEWTKDSPYLPNRVRYQDSILQSTQPTDAQPGDAQSTLDQANPFGGSRILVTP